MFKEDSSKPSLPADVLWGSFVTHSWRNECLTNEPQRTSAGRLQQAIQKLCFNKDNNDNDKCKMQRSVYDVHVHCRPLSKYKWIKNK